VCVQTCSLTWLRFSLYTFETSALCRSASSSAAWKPSLAPYLPPAPCASTQEHLQIPKAQNQEYTVSTVQCQYLEVALTRLAVPSPVPPVRPTKASASVPGTRSRKRDSVIRRCRTVQYSHLLFPVKSGTVRVRARENNARRSLLWPRWLSLLFFLDKRCFVPCPSSTLYTVSLASHCVTWYHSTVQSLEISHLRRQRSSLSSIAKKSVYGLVPDGRPQPPLPRPTPCFRLPLSLSCSGA